MNFWMVLYVGAHIGGTWGPLPYGLAECQTRATEMNQKLKDPAMVEKLKAAGKNTSGWKFTCQASAFRPVLGQGRDGDQLLPRDRPRPVEDDGEV